MYTGGVKNDDKQPKSNKKKCYVIHLALSLSTL